MCVIWRIHKCDGGLWLIIWVKWLVCCNKVIWRETMSLICVTWLIYVCDMNHLYVWRDSLICVTWHIYVCDMTHSYVWRVYWYVWRDSFMCVRWLIHMCDVTHWYVWRDTFMCVIWLIHMCDGELWRIHMCDICVTYLRDMSDSFTCATWLVHMLHTTHSCVWEGEVWLIDMCYMSRLYVWHDWFICVTRRIHTCNGQVCSFACVTRLIHKCDMTFSHLWHVLYIHVTWLIHIWGMSDSYERWLRGTYLYTWQVPCRLRPFAFKKK